MSRLSRTIRTTTRQASLFSAKVLAVSGNRATVRLSNNGTVYRSLIVYGGQVVVNQMVKVDMTTDQPFVLAPAKPSEPAVTEELLPATPKAKASDPPTLAQIIVDVNNPPKTTVPLPDETDYIYGYPSTNDGLRSALDAVASNGTIYIPAGEYGVSGEGIEIGSMTSGSGTGYYRTNIHIVGAGIENTTFVGNINSMVSCFLYDFLVEFTMNDSNNYTGIYCQADTYLERVKTNISNTGTGLGIGLFADIESRITTKQCEINGDDYGIYVYGTMFNLHFEYEARWAPSGGSDDISYTQSASEISVTWLANVFLAEGYQHSAAWGVVTAKPQQMSGKQVHIIWEITSGSTVNAPTNYPHKIEDINYWADDYGQSIPAQILAGNQMAASDESYVEYIDGTSGSSPYGVGNFIKWVWTNCPDFEVGNEKYNSVWFALSRYVSYGHPGVSQIMKLNRAYILNADGSIQNISPYRIYVYADQSKFSGATYDVYIGNWCTLEYRSCIFDSTGGTGTIVYVPEGTTPTYYGDEPTATYPGMLWIEE